LGIRQKLAVMLVVPLIGLLYFATSGVVERLGTLRQAGDLQDNAALAVKVSGLVHELQKERGNTVLFLGSKGKDAGAAKDLAAQLGLRSPAVAQGAGGPGARRSGEGLQEGRVREAGGLRQVRRPRRRAGHVRRRLPLVRDARGGEDLRLDRQRLGRQRSEEA